MAARKTKKAARPKRQRAGEYVGFRAPAELKAKLEIAAADANRSLSSEAQFRLEQSFADETFIDRAIGPKEYRDLAIAVIANFVGSGERYARRNEISGKWTDDRFALGEAVSSAIAALLEYIPADEEGRVHKNSLLARHYRGPEQP